MCVINAKIMLNSIALFNLILQVININPSIYCKYLTLIVLFHLRFKMLLFSFNCFLFFFLGFGLDLQRSKESEYKTILRTIQGEQSQRVPSVYGQIDFSYELQARSFREKRKSNFTRRAIFCSM